MSNNVRNINAPIDSVWSVVANDETYDQWVVGKQNTRVLESTPGERLKLRGNARPYGVAEIVVELRPLGTTTDVRIEERVVSGPGALVPSALQNLALKSRHIKTLKNLAELTEHR
jgi:hypothetical protein